MKKIKIIVTITIISILLPSVSFGMTRDEIIQRIKILEQIAQQLQIQLQSLQRSMNINLDMTKKKIEESKSIEKVKEEVKKENKQELPKVDYSKIPPGQGGFHSPSA